jgi:hypothetical protein
VVRRTSVGSGCTRAGAVSLEVGEVRAIPQAGVPSACLVHPGEYSGAYTLVVYNASTTDTLYLESSARGDLMYVPGWSTARREAGRRMPSARLAHDAAFERALRLRERREFRQLRVPGGPARGPLRDEVAAKPAAVGDLLRFDVSTSCDDAQADYRTGRVVAISRRAIIVADTANPSGGPTPAGYQGYAETFDSVTYRVDTKAFGDPTDIDGNGREIIFYTRAVNELTPAHSFSYVGGYFWAGDLFPRTGCPGSNVGEIFYMLAVDETGEINGNVRSQELVRSQSASVIAHEFQHLINASRRIYVNQASALEDVWLDEGLSHIAEELLFYRESGLASGRNLDGAAVNRSGVIERAFDDDMLSNIGRLEEAYRYVDQQSAFDDDDDLETRGAIWSLLRYAADRLGGDQDAFWYRLANSTTHGRENLDAALGGATVEWGFDEAIATGFDDAGFSLDPRYQHRSWDYRSVMGDLYGPFPLRTHTLSASNGVPLVLHPGAAAYLRLATTGGGLAEVRVEAIAPTKIPGGPNVRIAVVRSQ